MQVTLSLQAHWQKKQSNHPSSWHYQTYVTCTQAGNAALASKAAELGRGVSKHLWCRKTMFISAHKLTQTLASWRCEPVQSRTTSKRDVAVHDSRGEQGYRKKLCESRGKYFSVSGLLPASTRGACSRYPEWTLTRWVNTTRVCADRTLDDLLFIQIKIFPSIKLLQQNLSDVSLSGICCASFMRQYSLFLYRLAHFLQLRFIPL